MAVVGVGVAAERVVAHLAAAGVGWIAADETLHGLVDPALPGVTVVALGAGADAGTVDAAVIVASSSDDILAERDRADARAPHVFWIADGRAGVTSPCPRCAAAAATRTPPPPAELLALREAFLGTVVATEVVKTLLAIGTGLTDRVLCYDPTNATVTTDDVICHCNADSARR